MGVGRSFFLCLAHAFAQEVSNEPVAVVEVGAAPSLNFRAKR
jgi:hypothetical protein